MAYILYTDFFKAAARWEEVCPSQTVFESFIGCKFMDCARNGPVLHLGNMCFIIPTEVAMKFHMINGPHYRSIIKAYLINYYDEVNHGNQRRRLYTGGNPLQRFPQSPAARAAKRMPAVPPLHQSGQLEHDSPGSPLSRNAL